MSISNWFKTSISLIKKDIAPAFWARTIITGNPTLCEAETAESSPPEKPKRVKPSLEKCMAYMDSKAYKITYGDKPVWHVYVRNFKGTFAPKTRQNCWHAGQLNRGSPCPMCRDQYLVAHFRNVKLLKQFISPYGGQILDTKLTMPILKMLLQGKNGIGKTGVCQKQQENLEVAITKARSYGLLTFTVPHRQYDYSLYNKKIEEK